MAAPFSSHNEAYRTTLTIFSKRDRSADFRTVWKHGVRVVEPIISFVLVVNSEWGCSFGRSVVCGVVIVGPL
ncbi:hypothetical protein NDU88_001809 [Pleurodeles waltl]|uniref:Uncharacterized protein n=1 Tax=Pleurodeles waltl TaxID=8319 RepID=A0AAV7LYQ7_PLEWA|nr:hypothetical protein NDU88_001809 [Pleurodeles waltl]